MRRRQFLAAGYGFLAVAVSGRFGFAQGKKTRTVNGGGLTFEVPEGWKSTRPGSQMRRAQIAIPAAEGDKEDGECVLFAFPGGAGTVDANIERWAGQFRTESGTPPKPVVKKAKGKNTDVTVVEIKGRYVAPVAPGNPETVNKPGFVLLGAIAETPEVSYFLKVTGPEKTMKAAAADLDVLIASMTVEK
ncbi:hypothetical protein GC170_06385 [bacterium]|nr:hypothetical protein [bacterium]